ncbi:E3 ubiquitin-protein ligase SMURF2 [Phytophthora ramorum]|nr:E3 ubiquitin-protein ligase SMURF2 [Phytophthora ramorum]
MATAKRESRVKNILDQRHPRNINARKANHPLRGHRHLVTLSEEELSRRELGWNDRFTLDPPPKSNKVQSPAHSPTFSTPPTPLTKESKIRDERVQYGKRGGKRNREPKKPSSGKLVPLGALSNPPSEAAQPTKEEKLRFKVLKAIDARETLLYQLSALILCTPVQESLFLPSRPTEPPTSTSAGRQQMRSRGGMALASTPISRHGGNPGAMTNAREATKLAQQLAKDLQITGIQCVESLVEWMLEAGAQAETPPPFLWRGRNYFLKMVSDLDFAETELPARGVNLDCFRQTNPLLIKPNQKLGRVLAAHSIIMEMVEFAKDMTPMELLALSGRMRDSSREERGTSQEKFQTQTNSSPDLAGLVGGDNSGVRHSMGEAEDGNPGRKQELERHDHESAADLVDLLDESLDFMRGNPSRESVIIPTEQSNDSEYEVEDDDENNKGDKKILSDGIADDSTAGKMEPEEDGRPRMDDSVSEKQEALDMPTGNQSDYEDNSMGYNEHKVDLSNVEAAVSQLVLDLPQLPPETADDNSEKVGSNEATDEDLPEQGALVNTSEPVPENTQSSSRTDSSDNQSEYDNSFDAEAGDEDVERSDVKQIQLEGVLKSPESAEITVAAPPNESTDAEDATAVLDSPIDPPGSPKKVSTSEAEENDASDYENSFNEDADEDKANNDADAESIDPTSESSVPPILGIQLGQNLSDAEIDQPVPDTDDLQTVSKRLVDELKRWTFLEDENRPIEVNARGCLSWCSSRTVTETLEKRSSIIESVEGSIIAMLEQYGIAAPESPLKSFLCSEVAQELDLTVHLIDECKYVLDDISSAVAVAIQRSLESKNPLVSEIEIDELLEVAEGVRQEYHDSTWTYLKITSTLLIFLRSSDNGIFTHEAPASVGLSRLVKVFYPYLVNQPREELRDNWHPVSSVLAVMGLPVDRLYHILDPMCKTLLLAVELCNRSNQDSQDEDDFSVFPKVTIVCDREDVLRSSVEYVRQNHFSSEKVTSNFSLFPFFKSSFGEKLVDGVKVEEGEGKGPLKEWFGLVGTQLASKWKQIPTNKFSLEVDSTQATASGNAITIPGAADLICPGFMLEWETSGGEKISRVVNKCGENDTFLLDRGVPSHALSVSQLRISQPNSTTFEYVQASESYWLNENMRDSPETRNVLVFVGWLLASAVTHFSAIQLRIHPFFFRLLLNPLHCVTLEELRIFDSQLFNSLSTMKDMKPSDFADFLTFEGVDESLSVEAYIDKVLAEKFGPTFGIGWQLDSIRRGFTRVITFNQLSRVGITEADLAETICGSTRGYDDDFDINDVFRVAADTEFTSCPPLVNGFWRTVNSFEPQLKRKFIKFVTGVDTLPLGGTEFLRIEMPFTAISAPDHDKCLQMLPQAHTCDNTLELPHYWKSLCWREQHDEDKRSAALEEELALLLRKKLQDAVEYSSGYGLDGTSEVTGVLDDKSLYADDQLSKEESYDSLGLPALSEGHDLPFESSQPSPQSFKHEEAEQQEETEDIPAIPAAVVSPRPEESYDDYDWEEEEQSVS